MAKAKKNGAPKSAPLAPDEVEIQILDADRNPSRTLRLKAADVAFRVNIDGQWHERVEKRDGIDCYIRM